MLTCGGYAAAMQLGLLARVGDDGSQPAAATRLVTCGGDAATTLLSACGGNGAAFRSQRGDAVTSSRGISKEHGLGWQAAAGRDAGNAGCGGCGRNHGGSDMEKQGQFGSGWNSHISK